MTDLITLDDVFRNVDTQIDYLLSELQTFKKEVEILRRTIATIKGWNVFYNVKVPEIDATKIRLEKND